MLESIPGTLSHEATVLTTWTPDRSSLSYVLSSLSSLTLHSNYPEKRFDLNLWFLFVREPCKPVCHNFAIILVASSFWHGEGEWSKNNFIKLNIKLGLKFFFLRLNANKTFCASQSEQKRLLRDKMWNYNWLNWLLISFCSWQGERTSEPVSVCNEFNPKEI